jgi:Protein of unknown function (DUF732)
MKRLAVLGGAVALAIAAAPVALADGESVFRQHLADHRITYTGTIDGMAHNACTALDANPSAWKAVTQGVVNSGLSKDDAIEVVGAGVLSFCPQHMGDIPNDPWVAAQVLDS